MVSSIYILEHLDRMAALATHVAQSAHRRHPERVIPAAVTGYFEELTHLTLGMVKKTRDLLIVPDAEAALALARDDDAVDDLDRYLLVMLTQREWAHTTREAVDTALLARFYERFADQCVSVGTRIVYLTTGLPPEEYLAHQE
ncbi:hypothetical protein COCCU_14195 (plasmid) [Corynebacterium occultum]|uniref:PhoU domain-containing protein n=1 Tax=Corynebacterium occultum TaxID=2675219 RepID=A0A6B8W0K5_9CORY|nr:PhoU domain-containing protein [Corynebacterium occultum]QGU08729.1 hypothetical protein COCCU_14195 [Corynebacterium occultum]